MKPDQHKPGGAVSCELLLPGQDISGAQVRAVQRLIGIIDVPLTGNIEADYLVRRTQIEAANTLLRVKTRMMREMAAPAPPPTCFRMPKLETPADAVAAQAGIVSAVAAGLLAPEDGERVSRMVASWLAALKATRLNPLKAK